MIVLLINDVCCSINSGMLYSESVHIIWRVLAKETIYIQEVNGSLIQHIPFHLFVTFAKMF